MNEINYFHEKEDGTILKLTWQTSASLTGASQVALVVKNLPANAGGMTSGFSPWVGKVPWGRKWQPAPVFLPRESHGPRSLAGYSPQGGKESGMTEAT